MAQRTTRLWNGQEENEDVQSHIDTSISICLDVDVDAGLVSARPRLFASLAADKSSVPYSKDLADQRRKYGDSVLRRCDEHLATQRQHENEIQAKLDAARRKRQEEKETREAREVLSYSFFYSYHRIIGHDAN